MKTASLFTSVFLLSLFFSCGSTRETPVLATPPVVIYKTKKDYRELLTVQLSEDGSSISAYPAPSDALRQKPVELAGGYLLKRMPGDTYLTLRIDEYAASSGNYSPEDLLELVLDRDPYLEKYDCSGCTGEDTASINLLIREHKLDSCKSLL